MFYKVLFLVTILAVAYAVKNNETSSQSNYTGIPLPYTPAVARVVARALGIENYETVLDEEVGDRRPRILEQTIEYPIYNYQSGYSYGYEVHDGFTGDSKTQHETRHGDLVQGSYSLIDADGFRRIVEYTSDPVEGFKATVRREPLDFTPAARIQDYGFSPYGYYQH